VRRPRPTQGCRAAAAAAAYIVFRNFISTFEKIPFFLQEVRI
jgi:hypothetical protein